MFEGTTHQPPLQFLPLDKFVQRIKAGEFVEYKVADVPDMHYVGVSKRSIREVMESKATGLIHCQLKVGIWLTLIARSSLDVMM